MRFPPCISRHCAVLPWQLNYFELTPAMNCAHLNQIELARRWKISPRTLERWRWLKLGPTYLKIGNRVVYRMDDIESHEAERLHHHTQKQHGTAT